MAIVYATPRVAPVPAEVAEGRFMSWTGANGQVFVLTDGSNPAMQRGVQGLHMPAMTTFSSSTPLVHGVDLRGYTIPGREVFWPLMFENRSASEWRTEHAAFFDSFHPVIPGTWTVGVGEDARTLPLVGSFDGMHRFDIDPFLMGYAAIGLELFAPRPLWRGAEIRRTFKPEPQPDFIPADPADQNYYPTSIIGYSSASVRNPGNEPAYVSWEVAGPHPPGLVLGVGTFLVRIPFEIPEGSEFRLDTDPTADFATLDGVDKTVDIGFQVFAPVAPGAGSPLVINSGGTGDVTVKLTPLYWRAF